MRHLDIRQVRDLQQWVFTLDETGVLYTSNDFGGPDLSTLQKLQTSVAELLKPELAVGIFYVHLTVCPRGKRTADTNWELLANGVVLLQWPTPGVLIDIATNLVLALKSHAEYTVEVCPCCGRK